MTNFVIGDEAAFMMSGQVNARKVREHASRGHPPEFNYDRKDSRAKFTIWAGLCGNGVILGSYYFHGNVNGIAYLRMLSEYVLPRIAVLGWSVSQSLMDTRWCASASPH